MLAGRNLRECIEEEDRPGCIRHTSIHKAKGLDSKAVIVIGMPARKDLATDYEHLSWFMAVRRARQLLDLIEGLYLVPRLPKGTTFSHYRTHAGVEVDFVLAGPSGETVALEIKRTLSPKLTPGFLERMKTLQATKGSFIIPTNDWRHRNQFHAPLHLTAWIPPAGF